MSQGLEKFVQQHREEMDAFEPGPVVWNNISRELAKPKQQEGILISMRFIRRAVAAIIIIAAGTSAWYLMRPKQEIVSPELAKNVEHTVPKNEPEQPATNNTQPGTMPENSPGPSSGSGQIAGKEKEMTPEQEGAEDGMKGVLARYTDEVANKQRELEKVKTEEPLLYKQFAGDFKKLDSTYHILKQQLPVNPNREQILEAMIQNLQYQESLLTQQLNIIRKIKQAKKQAYEKAYQSI